MPDNARQLVLSLLLLVMLAAPAAAQGAAPARVWVNLRSGVYHCPGSEHYGKTSRGLYLPEVQAQARGYRANGGRTCGLPGGPAAAGLTLDSMGLPERGPTPPASFHDSCVLTEIVDGDTVRCERVGSIRLIGFDSPERRQQPFGDQATAALRALLPIGTTLRLEQDQDLRDRNGRLLAYIWVDGRMVNWLMVRLGWGVAYPFRNTARYEAAFAAAETASRQESRGLWRVQGFTCLPKQFRDKQCGN